MRKAFKYLGIGLGLLIALILAGTLALYLAGNARFNRVYDFPASSLEIPKDEASLAYGKHRAETLCQSCHGKDLGGIVNWLDAGPLGAIDASNLTSGEGGIGREFQSDQDYVRAIRHGINPQGKPIFMVAVNSTSQLSDQDLGAIIAYLKSLPPVDRKTKGQRFTALAKIMFAAGLLPGLPVENVSHQTQVSAPERAVSEAYGGYLVNTNDCRECHGRDLAGARHPDPTLNVITPNLTPGGEVGFWKEEQFIAALRSGVTPSGHVMDDKLMPWSTYQLFSDDELKAIYLYLQSLPRLPQFKG